MQDKYEGWAYGPNNTKEIKDEIHLLKVGEYRKLDHKITGRYSFSCNVPISIDNMDNSFYVLDIDAEHAKFIDNCGFIRVCMSYEAYQ